MFFCVVISSQMKHLKKKISIKMNLHINQTINQTAEAPDTKFLSVRTKR